MEKVARNLTGAAGLGGIDSQELTQWLVNFGAESRKLRQAVSDFASWESNDFPPWAAYRAIMSGHLVALDKCPGIHPIGIGEICRRLFAKCLLSKAATEATEACNTNQLCAGLKAWIEGAVHVTNEVWEEIKQADEQGFLIIDTSNAFNELNRKGMLWTVQHEWPLGARFLFNCYKHFAILAIRSNDGTVIIILSRGGTDTRRPACDVWIQSWYAPSHPKAQGRVPQLIPTMVR